MKKKSLWLIVLTVVMCLSFSIALAACGEKEEDKYSSATVLQIANKDELQAEWYEDGEDRTVKLTLPPELTENDVRITSNNPAVVLVEGKTLKAAGVGMAKITVFADDESDSVNIRVKQSLKEITITNKSELRKILVNEERTVEFSVRPDAYDVENAKVEITSSNASVVSVNDKTAKAVGLGDATLTVKIGNISDSVDVSVVNMSNPTFGIGDGTVVKGLTGKKIELPFAALSCDGKDLRDYVEAVCDNGLTFDKKTMSVTAAQKGEYSVTMSVADPRDVSKSTSVTFTVQTYRNIFADYNGYGNIGYESYEDGKQFVADAEQVTSFDRWDATFASFDMIPSRTYYAEIVIDSESKADWSTFYGMTHSVKGDASRWLTAYMDRGAAVTRDPDPADEESRYYSGARDFRIKDIDIENDMNCWELHQGNNPKTQILYSYGLNRFRGLDKIESFPCKLATARIGDFFYFFVNDDYVCTVTNEYLQGKDTVPGYFQQTGIQTDIKNIVWLSGAEAEAKFNALTDNGSKMFGEFAPSEWWKAENEASEHITHATDNDKGANYTFDTDALTGENKGIVTPYIFFDGNFTFEWEYQFDPSTTAGNWDRFMALEVRHLRDENEQWGSNYSNKYAFLFGSSWQKNGDNDLCAMVKCFSKNKPNDWDWEHPAVVSGGQEWYSNSEKLKYSVTRICMENDEGKPFARYTFVIQRADGTERSEWTYDDYGLDKWNSPCEPVILLWKNKGVKGTYSNVKWSIPEKSISIINKKTLQEKWVVGEDNRTVGISVTGNLGSSVTVTSSNTDVISVDGNTLKAVGGGTATITVKCGDFTDSVQITVTPALESVSITNKEDLSAAWKLSAGGTREVGVAFAPAEHYNANNTNVEIISSNTDVITVSGTTLTPVGVGRTTITIKVGDLTDTIQITITGDKPALSLDSTADIYGVEGSEITLPGFTVISVEGDEVEEPDVTVTCEGVTISDGKFTATEKGEYTVTYSYEGADDATVKVNVYRKAISSVFAEGDEVRVQYTENADSMNDEKQTIVLNTTKNTYAQFNMAAGKNFYGEATFVVAAQGGNDNFYGIYAADPTNTNRYLAAMTDRGNDKNNEWFRAVKIVDFDTTKDNWTDVSDTKYWCRNVFAFGRQISEKSEGSVTIALARIDDIFYMFIDGQAVMNFTAEDYNGKDLVVGIFQKNAVQNTQITAMTYLSGSEAETKFNTLTDKGSKLFDEYKPDNYWTGVNKSGEHIESSLESGKGANVTFKDANQDENASAITPNLYFDGDFTFELEFKFASGTTGGNWNKYMRVELRNSQYSDWGVSITATAQVNGGNNLCIGANVNRSEHGDLNGLWLKDEGYAKQYKFAISRVCGTNGNANYYFKAWQKDGEEYTLIYNRYLVGTQLNDFGAPDMPAIIVIKTVNVAGEYTNVKWSIPEKWKIPDSRVEISNKTDLAQRWIVGTEEREVGVIVDPNLFGYYTITSSAPEVVSVKDNKLKALAAGTATVTLTAGNKTDSVEITVIPVLSDISISNNEVLSAAWKLSDGGTREVGVAFAPAEHYNANNTNVEIISSNTDVITVSGTTLTPVGVGRTTITIKVGDLTDTIQITITGDKPALSLDSTADIYGVEGSEITLPGFTVISVEGDEVEEPDVTVTCEGVTISDGKFTATEKGEYTVTYSYEGADDATVKVNVYRKAISSVFAEGDEVRVQYTENADSMNDEKQTIVLNTTKNTYAQFNMAAGKNFYGEATFVVAAQGGNDNFYGIYAADPTNTNRYLAAMTDRGNDKNNEWFRAVKIVDFDTTKDNWTDVISTKFWCRNVFKYGQKITEKAEDRVTIALARIDDIFYMFIDGQAVMGFTAENYNGKDMVVGIFQKNAVQDTQITAMNYLSGEEAKTKFNVLTSNGSELLGEYRYNDWWENVNHASEYISSSEDAGKGANYTFNNALAGENEGIVTPNINFDSDFTFEWEFKFADGTTGGNWDKYMRVELRNSDNSDWGFRFTATAQVNGSDNLCIGANINGTDSVQDLGGAWSYDENYAGQYKFSISRKIGTDNTTFTFKAWKKNVSGEYELVHDKSWTGTETKEFGAATNPAIVVIKSVNVAGEYTNIKWSATATQE